MENLIFEVKNNCFDKVKSECDEKTKVKQTIEKNIELLKNKLKLFREQEKNTFKTSHQVIQSTKYYKNMETRMNHEMMINLDLDDLKVDVSRIKFDYEAKLEETRQLRNDLLLEEKAEKFAKEEFQRTNKLLSDCIKEKENFKLSINQLKKHIKLMREKVDAIEGKSKELLSKVYQITLAD